jgi:GR25 family glycosyltransferase involved in LPS biosynthesis
MIWETIASGSRTYGAVFEEDIHFSNDAADFLQDHLTDVLIINPDVEQSTIERFRSKRRFLPKPR